MSHMVFPPEVNSGLVYAGPGSAPLLSAATAWDGLFNDLASTATSVSNVVSGLAGTWQGASNQLLSSAAAPYITWLHTTAAQAAQIGQQAKAAAALFETVHSTVVPPPVIAANRALLLALIATNFFGQNTPAIMATEAHYEEMWAQDGAALDTYSANSQANVAALQKPTPAPPVSKSVGQDQASALAANGQQVPSWLQNIMSHLGVQGVNGNWGQDLGAIWNALGSATATGSGAGADAGAGLGVPAGAFQSIYYPLLLASLPARILPSLLMSLARAAGAGGLGAAASAGATGAASAPTALMNQIGEFVDGKMQGAVGTLVGHFNSATQSISAKLGQAASMGSLKVPQGWSAAADGMAGVTRAAPVLPNTTVSAPVQTMSAPGGGLPGGPFGNALMGAMAGRGMGAVAAKAPKIVPRSPSGG